MTGSARLYSAVGLWVAPDSAAANKAIRVRRWIPSACPRVATYDRGRGRRRSLPWAGWAEQHKPTSRINPICGSVNRLACQPQRGPFIETCPW